MLIILESSKEQILKIELRTSSSSLYQMLLIQREAKSKDKSPEGHRGRFGLPNYCKTHRKGLLNKSLRFHSEIYTESEKIKSPYAAR